MAIDGNISIGLQSQITTTSAQLQKQLDILAKGLKLNISNINLAGQELTKTVEKQKKELSESEKIVKSLEKSMTQLTQKYKAMEISAKQFMESGKKIKENEMYSETSLARRVSLMNGLKSASKEYEKSLDVQRKMTEGVAKSQSKVTEEIVKSQSKMTVKSTTGAYSSSGSSDWYKKSFNNELNDFKKLSQQIQSEANKWGDIIGNSVEEGVNKSAKSLELDVQNFKRNEEKKLQEAKRVQQELNKIRKQTSASSNISIFDELKAQTTQSGMQGNISTLQSKFNKISGSNVFDADQVKRVTAEMDRLSASVSKVSNNRIAEKWNSDFSQVKKSVGDMETQFKVAEKNAKGFGDSLTHNIGKMLEWSIAGSLIFGSLRQIKDSIKYIYDLDNALNEIRIVTGQSQAEVEKLATSYNKLAKEMSVSTMEVASQAADLYRQGLKEDEVSSRMESIIKYAKISSISVADSNKIITATMNATGESAEKVINIFSQLGDLTASGADEIGEALQRVASASENSGLSLEKTASWIATISSITRESASTIGRSLNSVISRYESIKSTGFNSEDATKLNDVTQALSDIGIVATDSKGQLREIAVVVDDLGKKWDSLSKNEKSYIATTMFGTFQRNRGLTLLNNYSDSLKNYENALNSAGVSDEKFQIYQESSQAAMDRTKNAWEGLVQSLLSSSTIKVSLNALTLLLEHFGQIALIAAASLIFFNRAALAKIIVGLPMLITDFARAIPAILGFSAATTTATGTTLMFQRTLGIIGVALTAITIAVGLFSANQDAMNRKIQDSAEAAKEYNKSVFDLVEQYNELNAVVNRDDSTIQSFKTTQNALIKTLGLEKDSLDLLNGTYEENITVIKNASKEKIEANKASLQAAYNLAKEAEKNAMNIGPFKQSAFAQIRTNAFADYSTSEISKNLKLIGEQKKAVDGIAKSLEKDNLTIREVVENLTTIIKLTDKYGDNTTAQYTKIVEKRNEYQAKIDATNAALDVQNGKYPQIADAAEKSSDSTQGSMRALATDFENLNKSIDGIADDLKELNQSLDIVSKSEELTGEQVLDLIKKYPQLRSAVIETANGYKIEVSALEELRKAQIEALDSKLLFESGMTQAQFVQLQERLKMYGIEIDVMTSAAEAQQELVRTMVPLLASSTGASAASAAVQDLTKLIEIKERIEGLKGLLKNPKFGVDTDKKKSSSDPYRADQEINEKTLERDLFIDINSEREKYNSLLAKNKGFQENATFEQKNILLQEQIDLYKKLQGVESKNADKNRSLRDNAKSTLGSFGVDFSGTGDNSSMTNFQDTLKTYADKVDFLRTSKDKVAYTDAKEKYENLEKLGKEFNERQMNILKASTDWWKYSFDIAKTSAEKEKNTTDELFKVQEAQIDAKSKSLKTLEDAYDSFGESSFDKKIGNIDQQIESQKTSIDEFKTKIKELSDAWFATSSAEKKERLHKKADEYRDLMINAENNIQAKQLERINLVFSKSDSIMESFTNKNKDLDYAFQMLGDDKFDEKIKNISEQALNAAEAIKQYEEELFALQVTTPENEKQAELFKNRIVELTEKIKEGKISVYEFNEKIKDLGVSKEDAGKALIDSYISSISDKINDKIKELEKLQDTDKDIVSKEAEIKLLETELDNLSEKNDLLKEQEDRQKRLIDIQKAQEELDNARKEKNTRVYHADVGFVWEVNARDVREKTDALQDLQTDYNEWERENSVKSQEKQKQERIKILKDEIQAKKDLYKKDIDNLKDSLLNLESSTKKSIDNQITSWGQLETALQNLGLIATTELSKVLLAAKAINDLNINGVHIDAPNTPAANNPPSTQSVNNSTSPNTGTGVPGSGNYGGVGQVQAIPQTTSPSVNQPKSTIGTPAATSTSSIIDQMKANSSAWSSADTQTKANLANANLTLGSSLGAYRDNSGTWIKPDGTKLFDEGGILQPGGIAISHTNKPERILSESQTASFDRLVDFLPNFSNIVDRILNGFKMPNIAGASGNSNSTTYDIHIDKVVTNDAKQFINNLSRFRNT